MDKSTTKLNLFPPDVNFDFEQFWSETLALKDSCLTNINPANTRAFLNGLTFLLEIYTQFANHPQFKDKFSPEPFKARIIPILNSLFDYVINEAFGDYDLLEYAIDTFKRLYSILLLHLPTIDQLHFSLEKALAFEKKFVLKKSRLNEYRYMPIETIIDFLSILHFNFSETDGQYLLDANLDKIGAMETFSIVKTVELLRFYPARRENLDKIINYLIPPLHNSHSYVCLTAILSYFSDAYAGTYHNQFYDWKPHLKTIFSAIRTILNSSITILNDEIKENVGTNVNWSQFGWFGDKDANSLFRKSVILIASFLVEYEEEKGQEMTLAQATLQYLEHFINSFLLTFHSNISDPQFMPLIYHLVRRFYTYLIQFDYLKKQEPERFKNVQITAETRRKFVDILMPLSNFAFSQSSAVPILIATAELIPISPHILPQLLPFCVKNMSDIEFTDTSFDCFYMIANAAIDIFSEQNIDDNLQYIPAIVDASIARIQNSVNDYGFAMRLLNGLAKCFRIPSLEDMNSKLTIKQRMAANSILKTIDPVIKYNFEYWKTAHLDLKEDEGEDGNVRGISSYSYYFQMFDDSIFESTIYPKMMEYLTDFMNTNKVIDNVVVILRNMSQSNPDLCYRLFFPKILEKFNESTQSKKKQWSICIHAIIVSSPGLVNHIPALLEIVKTHFAFNEDQLQDEEYSNKLKGNFMIGLPIAKALFVNQSRREIVRRFNPVIENDKYIWGRQYYSDEFMPEWYVPDDNVRKSAQNSVYEAIEPCLLKFSAFPTVIQNKIITRLIPCFCQSVPYRTFGSTNYVELKDDEPFKKFISLAFTVFKENICNVKSIQTKLKLISMIVKIITRQEDFFMFTKNDLLIPDIFVPRYMSESTDFFLRDNIDKLTLAGGFLYLSPVSICPNDIIETLESLSYNESADIQAAVHHLLDVFLYRSPDVLSDFIMKNISILENYNHTEDQLKGAVRYLMNPHSIMYLINNAPAFARFAIALTKLTFDKNWEMSQYFNELAPMIAQSRFTKVISECPEWRDMLNKITTYPRNIDDRHFSQLIQTIVYQEPAPSIEIVQFLFNSIINDGNQIRLTSINTLNHLFYDMKPIAPRSKYNTIAEFTSKMENDSSLPIYLQNLPFVDKITIGFNCKPSYYILYDGPSVFSEENERKYGSIRKFINEKLFSDSNAFESIFNSFVNLINETENAQPEVSHIIFWKGLSQLIRSQIVTVSKEKIMSIVNSSDHSLSSQIVGVCEFLAGVQLGLKHWPTADKKKAIEELLIPATTSLINNKMNDGTANAILNFANQLNTDLDYRRSHWLIDVCLSILKELSEAQSKAESKNSFTFEGKYATIYKNPLKVFQTYWTECSYTSYEELFEIMKNNILPIFGNIPNCKLDYLSILAQIFADVLPILPSIEDEDRKLYPMKSVHKLYELFFVEIFDKYKETSPERTAVILNELFCTVAEILSPILPFLVSRFKDICILDYKLSNISNSKYLHYGKNVLMKLGMMNWETLPNLNETLFEGIFKKEIFPICDTLTWNTRVHLVGFLHVLIFQHLDVFTKEQFRLLLDEILIVFIKDNNHEVASSALEAVSLLISGIYNDNVEQCAEDIIDLFNKASKDKKNHKNYLLPVAMACTMLSGINICIQSTPSWLPNIFADLENSYHNGICTQEIISEVNSFFERHQKIEIPEIEDFRYAFAQNYYS